MLTIKMTQFKIIIMHRPVTVKTFVDRTSGLWPPYHLFKKAFKTCIHLIGSNLSGYVFCAVSEYVLAHRLV